MSFLLTVSDTKISESLKKPEAIGLGTFKRVLLALKCYLRVSVIVSEQER